MDYTMEAGGTRNFEPWKAMDAENAAEQVERDAEDDGDVMKQLEIKTRESKLQMDALEALDELRTMNSLRAAVDPDEVLAHHMTTQVCVSFPCRSASSLTFAVQGAELDAEDEALVRSVRFENARRMSDDSDSSRFAALSLTRRRASLTCTRAASSEDVGASMRKRLAVDPLGSGTAAPTSRASAAALSWPAGSDAAAVLTAGVPVAAPVTKAKTPIVLVRKKAGGANVGPAAAPAAAVVAKPASVPVPAAAAAGAAKEGAPSGLALLGAYGSSDDDA
jgi:hypothetical protein